MKNLRGLRKKRKHDKPHIEQLLVLVKLSCGCVHQLVLTKEQRNLILSTVKESENDKLLKIDLEESVNIDFYGGEI